MDIFQLVWAQYPDWTGSEIFIVDFVILSGAALACVLYENQKISRSQGIAAMAMLIWLLLVIGSTVFTRVPGERQYQLEVFWSWKEIFDHKGRLGSGNGSGLLLENILNIFLLMPVGFLLPIVLKKQSNHDAQLSPDSMDDNKTGQVHWYHGLLAGVLISATIELLQLILCRGLFEFDDIIHNSIGCMVGCVLSNIVRKKK